MQRYLCLLVLAAASVLALPGRSLSQIAVLELFTSQGCSSCPPADALLAELARDERVLALSLHVDYWDYLGWRDRFARPENTRRQKAYAALLNARSIYTPQAIIQGEFRLVGSDAAAVRSAIARALAADPVAVLRLEARADGVVVTVEPRGTVTLGETGILHLITYDRPQRVRIDRGENAGRTITYTNVVRDWMRLGLWDGRAPRTFSAPLPEMGRGLAVVLQDGPVGPILAAARLEP